MYKYNLKIFIISKDSNIEEVIKSIEPFEHYSHEIKMVESLESEIISSYDIVIMEKYNDFDFPYSVLNECNVVLCTEEYKESYENLSAVVLKPINYNQLKYEVIKLLKLIDLEDSKRFTENCLDIAINSATDMFWLKTLDGIHSIVNDRFCSVVNKKKEDVVGKDHYDIWDVSRDDPNSGADKCKETEEEVIKVGERMSFNETVKSLDGKRQLVTYKMPISDKNGEVVGTIGWGHDITDLKNLGMELQILLDSVPYAILIKDIDGFVVNVNTYFESYFGIAKEHIVGTEYEEWAENKFNQREIINKSGHKEGVFYVNGEEKHTELCFENILDAFYNVSGQVCVFRDITVERSLQNQLREQSNTDFLSKLYNRRYLREYISNIDLGTNLTLFSIDLDNFKNINDTYGHAKGDEAIKLTSKLLKRFFNTDLVVRMGGDEFLVVKIGNFDIERLNALAQSLLDYLSNHFNKDNVLNVMSASVGVSQGVLEEHNFSKLLSKSDTALYEAKSKGKGTFSIYVEDIENVVKLEKKP